MAYDQALDARIRQIVSRWPRAAAKRMFGGICHLLNGNMLGGVYKEFLILRLGPEAAANAMAEHGARPFDITGRPMKGWVMLPADKVADDTALKHWLIEARAFVETLPEK